MLSVSNVLQVVSSFLLIWIEYVHFTFVLKQIVIEEKTIIQSGNTCIAFVVLEKTYDNVNHDEFIMERRGEKEAYKTSI